MPSRIDYYSNGNGYTAQPTPSRKSTVLHTASGNGHASSSTGSTQKTTHELLDKFVEAHYELEAYKCVPLPTPRFTHRP